MNTNYSNNELANKINEAFISVMTDYAPLTDDICAAVDAGDAPIQVTVTSVKKISDFNKDLRPIFLTSSL